MFTVTAFPTIFNQDTGTVDWVNMANAGADDASDASISLTSGSSLSKYMMATGFDFSAIPWNATILGVTAIIRRMVTVAFGIQDDNNYLVVGNSRVGTPKTAGFWDTSYQDQSFGNGTDLWGLGSLVRSQLDTGFGIGCRVSHFTGTPTGLVDYIALTVAYDAPMTRRRMFFAV